MFDTHSSALASWHDAPRTCACAGSCSPCRSCVVRIRAVAVGPAAAASRHGRAWHARGRTDRTNLRRRTSVASRWRIGSSTSMPSTRPSGASARRARDRDVATTHDPSPVDADPDDVALRAFAVPKIREPSSPPSADATPNGHVTWSRPPRASPSTTSSPSVRGPSVPWKQAPSRHPDVAHARMPTRALATRRKGRADRRRRVTRIHATCSRREQRPERRLDALLEPGADSRVVEREPRRLARLARRVAERLERRDDLALGRARRRPTAEPAATPAAETFSLSSKMIRSASFLPMPGIDTSTAWSCCRIASWRSAVGREPDDRQRDLRARRRSR